MTLARGCINPQRVNDEQQYGGMHSTVDSIGSYNRMLKQECVSASILTEQVAKMLMFKGESLGGAEDTAFYRLCNTCSSA